MGTDCEYGFYYKGKYYIWGNNSDGFPSGFGDYKLEELKARLKENSLDEWKRGIEKLIHKPDADNPSKLDLNTMKLLRNDFTLFQAKIKEYRSLDHALSLGYYQYNKVDYCLNYAYILDLDNEEFIYFGSFEEQISKIPFDSLPKDFEEFNRHERERKEKEDSLLKKRKREDQVIVEDEKAVKKQKVE